MDNLILQDTFTKELPSDPITENTRRQVLKACYSFVKPKKTAAPKLISTSKEVAALIGLSREEVSTDSFVNILTGNEVFKNTQPYAMCYGGHQFGNWAGQLGDGRAINLTEVVHEGKQWMLQLKGAGPTPYSRSADGLAVLRSSIREYLCSESMFHLGVPTTRALSLALTGDKVLRDMLYNGNAAYEKGAVVCRVAPSFIRFGNFEIFAARKDIATLKELTDYTILHFYPELGKPSKETYIQFFDTIVQRTMDMVLHWQRVGFVHGVMNTDNFSILGLTIDYGPYGWLEGYDPDWTPNTTDRGQRRYRFGNQAQVAFWNLIQLANALVPLIEDTTALESILQQFQANYGPAYFKMMRAKLGLELEMEEDTTLILDLLEVLPLTETDMTIFFRNLANLDKDLSFDSVKNASFLEAVMAAFYRPADLKEDILDQWKTWFQKYTARLKIETATNAARKKAMNQHNPKYVLRNYMAQLAIDAADEGDYQLIEEFLELLRQPYEEQPDSQKWFAKRPEWARNKVGCSMLSCSS